MKGQLSDGTVARLCSKGPGAMGATGPGSVTAATVNSLI